MPGTFSDQLRDALINEIFRNSSETDIGGITLGANVFIRLYIVSPSFAGVGGSEVAADEYAPLSVPRNPANWQESTGGSGATQNLLDLGFGTADESWGTIVAAAVWSAATGGTMLALDDDLATPQPVVANNPVKIPAGFADFSLVAA